MTNVSPSYPALAALLAEAAAAGLRLRVSAGGNLAIDGQPSPVLLSRLRANKHALLAALRSTPSTAGAKP
jgi:CO/xanthine dehydrogenase FAD-binding subunit